MNKQGLFGSLVMIIVFLILHPTILLEVLNHCRSNKGHKYNMWSINFKYKVFCNECEIVFIDELGDDDELYN